MAKNVTLTPGWACYLRVSDEDKQHPENSISAQRRAIETVFLQKSDLPVVDWYEDHLSGRTPDRPAYQRMLKSARAGDFSHLALARADRFGRDIVTALTAASRLIDLGITIKTADMPNLDVTTPDGWFMAVIQLGLAHRESQVLGARVKDGMKAKFLRGDWPFSAPDGYINTERRIAGKYERWIEPDPDRAHVIREARQLFATGKYTLEETCEILDARGYLRGNGKPWVDDGRPAKQTLHRILTNELYAGWLVSEKWGLRVHGNHEPLDDQETQDRIFQILSEHRQGKSTPTKHTYLLSDVLWSKEADCRFYSATPSGNGGEYSYYYTKKALDGKRIWIQCEIVDSQIPELLECVHIADDDFLRMRRTWKSQVEAEVRENQSEQLSILERRLSSLHGEEERLARLLVKGRITERTYDKLRAEWEEKLIATRRELRETRQGIDEILAGLDRAAALLNRAPDLWPALSIENQKRLIELLVRRLVVDQEGEIVKVCLHRPFAYLVKLDRRVQTPSVEVPSTGLEPVTFWSATRRSVH